MGLVQAACLVLAAGCGTAAAGSGTSRDALGDGATATATAGSEPSTVPLGEPYSLEGMKPSPRKAIATVKGADGWVFTLTAVRRTAPNAVVVEGLLDGTKATKSGVADWKDSRSTSRYNTFSGVSLMRDGDPTTYLPLRDKVDNCLCTSLPLDFQQPFPVFVVLSAPAENDRITVFFSTAAPIGPLEVTS